MSHSPLIATVLAMTVGLSPAFAQSPMPCGGGDDLVIVYGDAAPGSLVGGATATLSGGGDDQSVALGAVQPQAARFGQLAGGGTEAGVVYLPQPQPAPGIARRPVVGHRG